MASYQVTTVVTCADQTELDAFVAHCADHGVSESDPGAFASFVVNTSAKTVTYVRNLTGVSSSEWS